MAHSNDHGDMSLGFGGDIDEFEDDQETYVDPEALQAYHATIAAARLAQAEEQENDEVEDSDDDELKSDLLDLYDCVFFLEKKNFIFLVLSLLILSPEALFYHLKIRLIYPVIPFRRFPPPSLRWQLGVLQLVQPTK